MGVRLLVLAPFLQVLACSVFSGGIFLKMLAARDRTANFCQCSCSHARKDQSKTRPGYSSQAVNLLHFRGTRGQDSVSLKIFLKRPNRGHVSQQRLVTFQLVTFI